MLIRALEAWIRIDAPESVSALLADAFADLAAIDAPGEATAEIVWASTDDGLWHVSFAGGSSGMLDLAGALSESITEVNRLAAASVASIHTVLHAGVFEVGGQAVAVTGASGAGKSTLVAAAVLVGHGFLADEVCALDPTDREVHPYHRPIGLRPAGAEAIGVAVPPHPQDAFDDVYPWPVACHGSLSESAPLRLIAFVHRRPGPVEIRPVNPADALVRLTTLCLGTDGIERVMFRRLDQLVRDVRVVTISYDDSFAAVEALAEVVA